MFKRIVFALIVALLSACAETGPVTTDFSNPTVTETTDGVRTGNSLFLTLEGDPWSEDPLVERARWEAVFNTAPETTQIGDTEYTQGVLTPVDGTILDDYSGSLVFEEWSAYGGGSKVGPRVCLSGEIAQALWDQDSGCYYAEPGYEVRSDLVMGVASLEAEFNIGIPRIGYGGGYLRLECDFVSTESQSYWLNPLAQAGELVCSVVQITDAGKEVLWADGIPTRRL